MAKTNYFKKMKFGFQKDGLTINGKEFHPLNWSNNLFELDSNVAAKPIDAMELLETLSSANTYEASKTGKLGVLKTLVNKIMP